MLTVPEAARRTGRDPETVRRWIRAGRLTARKVGTQHVIEDDDLAAFLGTADGRRAEQGTVIREGPGPYPMPSALVPIAAQVGVDVWLPQIVGRIVRALDPVRIILFGSRARGDQRIDSDYDLLVVLDVVDDRRTARTEIGRLLGDLPISKDVVVATLAEIDGSLPGRPAGVVYWALREGRLIYDRGDVI